MANRTKTSAKRKGRRLVEYFVGRPGGGRLPLGVWQRAASALAGTKRIRPVAIFVEAPVYKVRFKFYEVAERVAHERFPKELEVAFQQAFATAR
jgi:hypothetical protein